MQSDAVIITDAEKTRLLAEGVMGWTVYTTGEHGTITYSQGDDKPLVLAVYWSPLTNEAHSAEVREQMRALGYNCLQLQSIAGVNLCDFFSDATTSLQPKHVCKTPAIAICHAALLALGLAKEEEP